MYVITGATSNTGRVVAHRLLDEGKQVRVIGRSLERLEPFTNRGAEGFIAEPTDPDALIEAFSGAEAAWLMLQPNYIPHSEKFAGYQDAVTNAIFKAASFTKLPYAVTLSSCGADQSSGTGSVLGLHQMEQRLNTMPSLNLLHLRAGYFMENTPSYIYSILKNGKVTGPFNQNLKLPFISTQDIGHAAADALISLSFTGRIVQELHGQRDLSIKEAVSIIGAVIDIPGLIYEQNTVHEFGNELLAAGVS